MGVSLHTLRFFFPSDKEILSKNIFYHVPAAQF